MNTIDGGIGGGSCNNQSNNHINNNNNHISNQSNNHITNNNINSLSSNNNIGGIGGTGVGVGAAASLLNDPALPTQFVLSMKTLFDILDDQQTGFVKFSDIEKGWQDERCIELLRKVTPASGLLSFERFCGGLKLCLLKNQKDSTTATTTTTAGSGCGGGSPGGVRGGGGGAGDMHKPVNINPIINSHSNTATTTNTSASTSTATTTSNNINKAHQHSYYGVKACKAPIKLAARPPSAPMLEIENPLPSSIWGNGNAPLCSNKGAAGMGAVSGGGTGSGAGGVGGIVCGMANLHTSHMVASKSMPQLSPDSEESEGDLIDSSGVGIGIGGGGGLVGGGLRTVGVYHSPPPPPKPPRAAAVKLQATNHIINPNTGSTVTAATTNHPVLLKSVQGNNKAEIRNALQNWQMNILLSEMDTSKDKHKAPPPPTASATAAASSSTTTAAAAAAATASSTASAAYMPSQYPYHRRGCADGGSSSATESAGSVNGHTTIPLPARKSNAKRRDSRRHTLQNGIDYNMMMRRLKQLEEEREMLLLALNAVDRARDCYVQQVAHIQEKIKYLGLMGHVEQWSEEAQQERLNYQRARILEVNRCLAALAETCYPMHLNLAFSGESSKTSAAVTTGFHMPSSVVTAAANSSHHHHQSTKICDADVVY